MRGACSRFGGVLHDATNLIGKLPITALEKRLTALTKERESAAAELEQVNLKMLSSVSALF